MARSASTAKKPTKKKAATRTSTASKGFSAEERAAMRERAKELKAAGNKAEAEKACLEAIAKMPKADRTLAQRLHELITATGPDLAAKTW